MLSNQDLNQYKSSPSINNQFQNNTSQIVNYYINLNQNLNMNNPNYSLMPKLSLMESANNLSSNNNISNPINANIALLNKFIISSYLNNLQFEENYLQYCEKMSNCNNIIANQNEKITKEAINFSKKKRRRKANSNEKTDKNKKIINLVEKNGAHETIKIEHSIDNV
jgi:hypothetical protein